MVTVTRKNLKIVSKYIDTNNPKEELNYLYVDSNHIVSTDTKALGCAKHYNIDKNNFKHFLIHKSIVDLALKQPKAEYFKLCEEQIVCLDSKEDEIIIVSKSKNSIDNNFNYPEYKKILKQVDSENITKIAFTQSTQIDGIFAINKVQINPLYLPEINKKGKENFGGYIKIKQNDVPVAIEEEDKKFTIVLMPIIDERCIFRR